MMATEISIPTLTGSTNYELWKLQTQAWTVVTELSKEKQAVAVALNLPEDDKRKIKEKVFGELEHDVLNSENGMSVLFEFLDRYLLEDELMNSWNTFEDFEKFERKHGQNIREYVTDFDLKFRKLEKIQIKLPSEILAFKLLRNANLSKQERMLVLTGVNFAEKEKMYVQTKHSLIKFMGDLKEEKARMGPNVRLEPGWKKLVSCSYNLKGSVDHGSNGVMKKKLNPLGLNGQILLCKSCGSYRHFVADCPDSWDNMMKRKASKGSMKSNDRSNNEKIMGKTGLRDETQSNVSHFCNGLDSVDVEELAVEVKRLKKDIGIIKDEIIKIKAENNELKRQKEELKGYLEDLKLKKERPGTQCRITLQENNKKILKFQEERKDSLELMKNCQDGKTETENIKELRFNVELGKQIKKQWDRKESKEKLNIKGEMFRNIYKRQVRENETAVKGKLQQSNGTKETKQRFLEKAKIVKQKLQMNKGCKMGTWRKESLIQQLLDVILRINEWNQTRMWGWCSEDSQQLNDMTLQIITGNWFSKL